MTDEEKLISDTALVWARANKKSFARALADPQKYPGEAQPVSVFMAGSPGAGKTEVAKALTALFRERVLHIDPDDFRSALPGYNGKNSWLFQAAVSVLLGKVLDLAFEQKQSFLLDGTLSNMKTSTENVERAVKRGEKYFFCMYIRNLCRPGDSYKLERKPKVGTFLLPDLLTSFSGLVTWLTNSR